MLRHITMGRSIIIIIIIIAIMLKIGTWFSPRYIGHVPIRRSSCAPVVRATKFCVLTCEEGGGRVGRFKKQGLKQHCIPRCRLALYLFSLITTKLNHEKGEDMTKERSNSDALKARAV
jgi:hypothetical protein